MTAFSHSSAMGVTSRLGRVVLVALALCSACGERLHDDGGARVTLLSVVDVPEWTVATEPELEIGDVEGDSAYQFHRVHGVVRLANDQIAVLDAGSSEIRFFDINGRFVRKTGRKGDGPGEFRRPWAMYLRGDTLYVVDSYPLAGRLSLHTVDGVYITSRPHDNDVDSGDAWLHDNSVIAGGAYGTVNDQVRAALPRLPRPDTAIFFREVRVAGTNELWVRRRAANDSGPGEWIIFDYAGNALGRTRLPDQFAVYDARDSRLLGVWKDSLGVESVRVLRLVRPAGHSTALPGGESSTRRPGTAAAVHETLRTALRAVALYQEHYYARPDAGYVFARSLQELAAFDAPPAIRGAGIDPPPGVVMRILTGTRYGWFAVAADTASGAICGTGGGFDLTRTWSSGTVACF